MLGICKGKNNVAEGGSSFSNGEARLEGSDEEGLGWFRWTRELCLWLSVGVK